MDTWRGCVRLLKGRWRLADFWPLPIKRQGGVWTPPFYVNSEKSFMLLHKSMFLKWLNTAIGLHVATKLYNRKVQRVSEAEYSRNPITQCNSLQSLCLALNIIYCDQFSIENVTINLFLLKQSQSQKTQREQIEKLLRAGIWMILS